MSDLIPAAMLITATGAASTVFYRFLKSLKNSPTPTDFSDERRFENVLGLQALYGYNPQSLVSLTPKARTWFDFKTQSGLSYFEHGKIRLVAGDILAADENVAEAVEKFVGESRAEKKAVAFLPATEKFSHAVAPLGFRAVKIGASPYFDLTNWNPRGNSAKKMRAGCNQARRGGISIEQIFQKTPSFRREVFELSRSWEKTRLAGISFGWLFELNLFLHDRRKKYFAARDREKKLVGLLTASPMPARDGWYLEDFLRFPDSPRGTIDLLVCEALKTLAGEGAKIATLGTAPLARDGTDSLSCTNLFWSKKLLGFARENLDSIYNFRGLRRFKAKFVPSWWESEYVLLPNDAFISPRVAGAFAHALLPKNLFSVVLSRVYKNSKHRTETEPVNY